jgi:diguanylate cyclase (GGDEF)-like protein
VLQTLFAAISATLDTSALLPLVMRGLGEALQVRRVVFFETAEDGRLLRSLVCGQDSIVLESDVHTSLRRNGLIEALQRGDEQLVLGNPDDGRSPLPDARGSFCMVALRRHGSVAGILYIDDPVYEPVSDGQVRLLLDFVSQASRSIENAELFVEMKRMLEEVNSASLTDPLTGLANRRSLGLLLERELSTAERYGAPFAYAIIDLDNFKAINDSKGHDGGDEALRVFAKCLNDGARRGDIVARFAGDEFVLVIAQARKEEAELALARVMKGVREAGLSCSIGTALYPNHGSTAREIHSAADQALYVAKDQGKDQVQFFTREEPD